MKRHFLLQIALAFALLLGIVAYASRLLNLTGSWTLDLAGDDIATLSPATKHYLRSLETPLSITYFATARENMPAHLKELEPQVRQLLSALRDQAPNRIDYRVINPDQSGRTGIGYAASKKASSFSVRRVLHDEHSEQKIWSSLVIARTNAPEVLVQSIEPEHLPYLEEYVIAQLQAGRAPPQPTFGVSAPPPFQLLAAFLNEAGPVVELDLNRNPTIPPEIDVLFWIQPEVATPEHVRQLLAFLASGRSAVLAGSSYQIGYAPQEDAISYWVHHSPPAWAQLLQPFGLRPVPDLLVDKNTGPVLLDMGEIVAPFHLRVLPAFYNMKSFAAPGRGGLNFVAASALEVDPQAVQAKGFHAEIVGTTTESPRVLPLPTGPFTDADLTGGLPVPKQNLLVLLKPDDPWQGQLFVLASASPFQDGIINQPGYAHRVFLQNLIRTYGQPERVLRGRVEKAGPQRLIPPGTLARFFWRFFTVFLVPLAFVGLGVRHYLRYGRPSWSTGRWGRQLGLACLVLLVGALVWRGRGPYLDLTADQLNTPSPLLGRLLQGTSLSAELIATHRASMPRPLKDAEDRIRTLLADCNIPLRVIRPDALTPDQQQTFAAEGLAPFPVERVLNDTLATQYVWSGLRLLGNGHTIAIPRLDQHTLRHLEFLLAAASHSLQQGRKMRVAVISDLPRLSPAEALEDYQKKGLIAPGGTDVYSDLKALLADYLYDVHYINPRTPVMPQNIDVLVWMQPRRDSGPILLLLSQHLAQGGKAIVAMQHFNIQQRQYRGSGFQTVYWPQPQFQDLDRYLKLFGVEQLREVLFDRTQSHLDLETQVNRTAMREYDPQQVALPFLIRAVGQHYDHTSPLTRHLGDLLFIWGNRFALHESDLTSAGIMAQTLISTSPQAWAYPWQGGWLPPEVFAPQTYLPGPQPLAALLTGPFPKVAFAEDEDGRSTLQRVGERPRQPGTLLLIGSSEMFKNEHLLTPGFQHDQFLLNAVAYNAYGEELATLQARQPTPRGFPFQSTGAKRLWRVFVVGAGPLLFLAYALYRRTRRTELVEARGAEPVEARGTEPVEARGAEPVEARGTEPVEARQT